MATDTEFDFEDLERRMKGALSALQTEFQGLRTGRASVNLLDTVTVEAYGAPTPLNQVGSISVPEARMLAVNIWDKANVAAADKAIRDAGLGLNPIVDGQNLRIPIPPLNEERRRDLQKIAGKYAESAKVSVRNIRRDGMETLKKLEKDGEISQDEQKSMEGDVQALTDRYVKDIEKLLSVKEEEIMQV